MLAEALAFFEAVLLHDLMGHRTAVGENTRHTGASCPEATRLRGRDWRTDPMLARNELVGPGGERGRSESSYMGGGMAALAPLPGRPSSSYGDKPAGQNANATAGSRDCTILPSAGC